MQRFVIEPHTWILVTKWKEVDAVYEQGNKNAVPEQRDR